MEDIEIGDLIYFTDKDMTRWGPWKVKEAKGDEVGVDIGKGRVYKVKRLQCQLADPNEKKAEFSERFSRRFWKDGK